MADIITSDSTRITTTELTAPEQVTRTRTIDEVVADAGFLRRRARLLGEDVAATSRQVSEVHQRAVVVQLNAKARTIAKRSVTAMLSELANAGFAWRDIAALAGVSVPAVRRWRQGEAASGANRLAVARIVALVETLRNDHLVADVASWMEVPLVSDAPVTAIDLAAAGHLQEVVEISADHSTGEEVLDRLQPGWRERYRSQYEVFLAPDGELGTRPAATDNP
jgi:hypothetical protein